MRGNLTKHIRYVQRALFEETGLKVSYQWVFQQVTAHLTDARRIAEEEGKTVDEVLLGLIRPRK